MRVVNPLWRWGVPVAGTWRLFLLLAVVHAAAGCEGPTKLPVTPNVLRDGSGSKMLSEAPADCRTPEMKVLYVTDRAPFGQKKEGLMVQYGFERTPSVAMGEATVALDPAPTWEGLVQAGGSKPDGHRMNLKVTQVRESGRLLITPDSMEVVDGKLRFKPEVTEKITTEKAKFMTLLESRLAASPRKDVYIYVHGVANSFDDTMCRAAVMWHYTGRQGVFIAFAWPAGKGGAMGYFYDRESGEYSVIHLKRLLQWVATSKAVERVHIIAHSRGGDVSTTALRELNLEYQGRGEDPQQALKLQTLVLAAADLDAQLFSTRLFFENLGAMSRRVVIYSSAKDQAVGLADWLFHSSMRLGTLSREQVKPEGQKLMSQLGNIECVRCSVSGFGTSHDYVFTDPAALSDLILVLRDGRKAGAENGRPLDPLGQPFWQLDNKYAMPTVK